MAAGDRPDRVDHRGDCEPEGEGHGQDAERKGRPEAPDRHRAAPDQHQYRSAETFRDELVHGGVPASPRQPTRFQA